MTKYVIRSEGYASGIDGGAEGKFLAWYDPRKDGRAGEEMGGWTDDPDKAMQFDSIGLAHQKWREPMVDRENKPVQRPDGSGAERPLTAFSVSVLTLKDAKTKPTIATPKVEVTERLSTGDLDALNKLLEIAGRGRP